MGQQAIVGPKQGHMKRTLFKSHTKKNLNFKEFSFNLEEVWEGRHKQAILTSDFTLKKN